MGQTAIKKAEEELSQSNGKRMRGNYEKAPMWGSNGGKGQLKRRPRSRRANGSMLPACIHDRCHTVRFEKGAMDVIGLTSSTGRLQNQSDCP